MSIRSRQSDRFKWSVFHGRCRRNLLVGLALFVLAGGYGAWAAQRFSARGADTRGFDHALVQVADRMLRPPPGLASIKPENVRELYLSTVISDQRDVLVGETAFMLRLIVVMTGAGFGLVLITAGATEWEVRSELGIAPPAPSSL